MPCFTPSSSYRRSSAPLSWLCTDSCFLFVLWSALWKGSLSSGCAVVQASLGVYAEFDLQSGCKIGSTEASGTALNMSYSPEGSQLLVLTAERSVLAFALPGWKRRVLVPPSSRYNMQRAHMAVLPVGTASTSKGNDKTACRKIF